MRAREEPPETVLSVLDDADRAMVARAGDDEQQALETWRIAVTKLVAGRVLDTEPDDVELSRECSVCGGTDHGRLRIAARPGEPSLSISAAASDGAVVVAVGVDVEVGVHVGSRRDVASAYDAARAALAPEDAARLDESDDSIKGDAVLAAVAQIEAYAQVRGTDASHAEHDLVVSLDPGRPEIAAAGRDWYARRIDPGPAYLAVLVADKRPRAVRSHDATELLIDLAHRAPLVDADAATATA